MESVADGRSRRGALVGWSRLLLVVVALAASCALLFSQAAAAQQTPTELWEGNPLVSEAGPAQDESEAAAEDVSSVPFLGIILTLCLLLLVLAFGMGVHHRDWVPKGLRERWSGLWEPSPLYAAAEALRRAPSGSISKAPPGAKGSRADAAKKPSRPARAKALPGPMKPPGKPAKPARAVKPKSIPKPSQGAKSPGALKPTKPAPWTKPRPSARVKPPAKAPTRRGTKGPSRRAELRPVSEQPPPAADSLPTERTVTCSIFGWRDGKIADFYAVAFGLQGHNWIVERSPRFLWSAGDVPAEAYEAHATLVDALVRAGWRPTGYDGAWYRQRFERAIEPVPERP
jgi:hypothetical protein